MATQPDPRRDAWPSAPTPGPGSNRSRRFAPRWRVFTWFILAFNILMLAWVIGAIASHASTCHGLTGNALTNCEAGNVGVGVAATLLFVFWALGDVILGVLWLVTRPRTRICPVCGNGVKRGVTQCRCGYDFVRQYRVPPPGPPQQAQPPPATWGPPPASARPRSGGPGEAPHRRSSK